MLDKTGFYWCKKGKEKKKQEIFSCKTFKKQSQNDG